MELPVVIFVSAVTGAISSIIVQLLYRKVSTIQSTVPTQINQQAKKETSPSEPERLQSPPAEEKKVPISEEETEQSSDSKELVEDDESNILTSSDLSHHVPKLGRFKDLNIPSIDDESIQVSDVQIPNAEVEPEEPVEETPEAEIRSESSATQEPSEIIPNTVPEHDDVDDEATVLVQRTPPK